MSIPITVHVFAYVVKDEQNQDVLRTTVSPEVLNLQQNTASGPVTIHFQIESENYCFQQPVGVEFVSPDHQDQFGEPSYGTDLKSAEVENRNSDGGAYAYRVYVTDKVGRLKASIDPVVQNDTR
jgi:hypothetical protein